MTIRVALTDFALKNPFYAGATCTVYQVDPTTLARTTAYATLYAAPTGGTLRANPMTLDSDGKFPTPLYVDQPVILVVKPVAGAVEQLGVQGLAPSRWRGVYTAGTVYYPGERFRSPSSPATYIVLRGFTATSFISDLINPAPLFEQELDADSLLDGVSASLFGTLLPNTPALGYYRINAAANAIEARTPAQVRSDISALSSGGGTITGDLTLSRTAASASLTIDTSDPRQRYYRISTAGLLRWDWGGGNAAESGANAGTPFTMAAYDDTGALIGTVYQVVRATRQIQLHGAGTAAAPTVSFIGDDDTGFYSPGTNQFGIATGGALRFQVGLTQITSFLPLSLPDSDPPFVNSAVRKAYADLAFRLRNRIINGAMQISQERGTAAYDLTSGGGHVIDQWVVALSATPGGTLRTQQVASITPGGSPYRLRATVQVADASIAAGDYYVVSQPIEGLMVSDARFGSSAAKPLLVRLGVRSSIAGTFGVSITNSANTRSWVGTITIAAGEVNTDLVRTLTIPGDVTGTWLTDTGVGLNLRVCLVAGTTLQGSAGWQAANAVTTSAQTNFMGTAGATFELFDVGLYVDTLGLGVFPPWELPDAADELRRCQRYYQQTIVLVFNSAWPTAVISLDLKVQMRSSPVVSLSGISSGSGAAYGALDNNFVYQTAANSVQATATLIANSRF